MDVHGTSAIVTGGASGLGAGTARMLAAAGAKVAIFDMNMDLANQVAAEIDGMAIKCDVSNANSAEAAVLAAQEAHGSAAICVNCAGVGTAHRIVGRDGPVDLEVYAKVINVNLIGTFNVLRLAAANMVAVSYTHLTLPTICSV